MLRVLPIHLSFELSALALSVAFVKLRVYGRNFPRYHRIDINNELNQVLYGEMNHKGSQIIRFNQNPNTWLAYDTDYLQPSR